MNKRILFATDVPFWRTSTGAEQRIFSMHRYLIGQSYSCRSFFLGELSEVDLRLIDQHQIRVDAHASHEPPEKLRNRLRWYADATINQARNWLSKNKSDVATIDGPPSLKLKDFEWPWAKTKFGELVEKYAPTAIVFEYIKMGYLMDSLTLEQKQNIRCLVDTHDVLHRRADQFFAHGFPHWLDIDREGESESLKKFDAIIAIQQKEADTFSEMTNHSVPTLTVGHAVDRCAEEVQSAAEVLEQKCPPDKVTVGYIGSKNFSNWQAISEFLKCAWPYVIAQHKNSCDLVIAGGICEWLSDRPGFYDDPTASEQLIPSTEMANVKIMGTVDSIEQFYDEVDIVINPVEFGTGLKIKNAESLRFGKLLITTTNGFDGMPEATRLACMVVESVNEMGLAINSICNDLSSIRPMQKLALQLSQTEFSETQAYSDLKNYLEGL